MHWLKQWVLVMVVLCIAEYVNAKQYVPESSDEIVHVFSSTREMHHINELRNALLLNPGNYKILNKTVNLYLKLGREKSDPRYFGYAEALLSPYLMNNYLPEQTLIHWADILQHRHDFDQALKILNGLAGKRSENPQVYLMRAIIHISRGEYDQALNNCKSLITRATHLVTVSCVAQVKSLTGELQKSFELLRQTLDLSKDSDQEEKIWAITLLGDMAVRIGKFNIAEKYYQQVLMLNDHDYYVLASYADLLLKWHQFDRVISLLGEFTYVDKLLLRLAQASIKTGDDLSEKYIAQLESGYRLNELRGEKVHLRDQAIFYFSVKNNLEKALSLAKRNWKVQKEPADIKLLLNISINSGNKQEVKNVAEWISEQLLEDIELDSMLNQVVSL